MTSKEVIFWRRTFGAFSFFTIFGFQNNSSGTRHIHKTLAKIEKEKEITFWALDFYQKKSESFASQFAFWVSYSFSGQALFINFRRGWTANFNGFYHAFFIASTHFFCIGIEIRLWSFKIECQMNRIKKPSCSSLIFCLCFLQSSVALAPCI